MKIRISILALAAASMLTVSGFAVAQSTAKPPKAAAAKTTEATAKGTVASMDANSFTLQGKNGAKGETFKMDSATTKTGTLATGAQVTVHYKMDGGEKLAVQVTAAAPKAAKSSTSTSTAAKPAK